MPRITQKGFVHIPVLALFLVLSLTMGSAVAASKIKITKDLSASVLGDEEDNKGKVEDKDDDSTKIEIEDKNLKTKLKMEFKAKSDFPLTIDASTNQLIVSTPAGEKAVTVLPDHAVQNMLDTKKFDSVSAQPGTTQTIKLEMRNNKMVYRVGGVKKHKVVGIIPVDVPVTFFVSADTGDAVAQEQSLLSNLIDFLSP